MHKRKFSLNGEKVNFNSISQESGMSKTFLYKNQEVRSRIKELNMIKQANQKIL